MLDANESVVGVAHNVKRKGSNAERICESISRGARWPTHVHVQYTYCLLVASRHVTHVQDITYRNRIFSSQCRPRQFAQPCEAIIAHVELWP